MPEPERGRATLLRLIAGILAEETGARVPRHLAPGRRAGDIPGWDSLSHCRIVLALERRLGVAIDIARTYELPDLGAFADYLRALTERADA